VDRHRLMQETSHEIRDHRHCTVVRDPALAKHGGHGSHGSPYAGQHQRPIKALSTADARAGTRQPAKNSFTDEPGGRMAQHPRSDATAELTALSDPGSSL
jgi:hypothetical protein